MGEEEVREVERAASSGVAEAKTEPKVREELLVLTSESCPGCSEFKEVFKSELESGRMKEVRVETDEGRRIVELLGIREVPSLVKKEGRKVCRLDEKLNVVECREVEEGE